MTLRVGRPRLPARLQAAVDRVPENVRRLSWVSLANDVSSELAYPLVPLFLTVTLGAPVAVLGLIEGVAEGVSVGLRGVAGGLSDRRGGRRLPWVLAGYTATAVSRPLLALAPGWGMVLAARLVDRTGKAIRNAPRDALLRDSTPDDRLGSAFGFHRAMDTAGATFGPLVAVGLLALGLSLRGALLLTAVPALAAVLLVRRVQEVPPRPRPVRAAGAPRTRLPRSLYLPLGAWALFSLGNSSDAFLLLRAHDLGLTTTLTVLAYAAYNLVYCLLSWPFGTLSDRVGRQRLLLGGLVVFALVYLAFAAGPPAWALWPLFAVYGVYTAATEGVARAWIADRAGPLGAGTAYGAFATATGGALLVASVGAGLLWSHVGHWAPFAAGVASSVAAAVLLLVAFAGRRTAAARA